MNRKQQDYNQTINLISHLILTKPQSVISLLSDNGVRFTAPPNRKQLIDMVVELMKDHDRRFIDDLGDLVTLHIQKNGKEMLQLDSNNSYIDEDDEDEFWGALAKGAISLVGGLFGGGKKRKNRRRAANAAAAQAASRAAAQRATQQAERIRMDMQRKMEEMIRKQREREEQLRREQEEQKRKEEARIKAMQEKAKQSKNTMLMIVGGLAIVVVLVVVSKKSAPKAPVQVPYIPPVAAPVANNSYRL